MSRRILVVGAGIAGLSLASALQRRGMQADVVEMKADIASQPGVGLSLQGNALRALDQIGLARPCVEAGVPADVLNLRRPDGELMVASRLLPMGGDEWPGICGISRSVLHGLLFEAAQASGAQVRLGCSWSAFDEDDEGIEVTFTDGRRSRYDLVVGADGLYSALRRRLFPEVRIEPCGQAVWRAGVPRPPGNHASELHFGGPHGVVGLCPISATEAYIYIVEAAPPGTRHADVDLPRIMADKLRDYPSRFIQQGVPAILDSSSVSYRPLDALLIPERWFEGRTVLIGDAAHSGPPVLAQGAAMGIEDAVVLAELLAEQPAPIAGLLERFMARRLPRARMIVENSVQLCRWEVEHSATPQQVSDLMARTQRSLCEPA